ncbi:hypothetical protein HPP92_014420 [Vanilla planifolia]|uniref:Uncharacterized protein n=1 Tax=Vanilla planifolia TaxID=51239 RepID=A0A835QRI1_VANPL|nr:hypothetical protein HPP92_014420 [Vanilla planifolia]
MIAEEEDGIDKELTLAMISNEAQTSAREMDCSPLANLNSAWERFYKQRWPENIKKKNVFSSMEADHFVEVDVIDWQQLYWERHLQECLDAATEQALLPAFDCDVAELEIPGNIMSSIGHFGSDNCPCSKLLFHCHKFGCYIRTIRLQSVLCNEELCELLRASKLQGLVLRRITSRRHVDGVCKLINQHRENLVSVDLVYCKLSPLDVDMICSSFYGKETNIHDIQHFSIKTSNIFGNKSSSIRSGLLSFLSSGRSLRSVCFADSHLRQKSAEAIFEVLIDSSHGLLDLEISGNELNGWLSRIGSKYASFSQFSASHASLLSLRLLNLRANNLHENDVEDLLHVLVNMPNLRSLDLSANPIGDDGVRRLIPFFVKALEETSNVAEIWLENCELSGAGVAELCRSLAMTKGQLETFSVADNDLGSSVAAELAKALDELRIKHLNIEDIGLGPLGFQELERKLPKDMALTCINISKNRGGIQAVHFICHLVSLARSLVLINAGSNLLPPEALSILPDALKKSEGKLKELDLTGNPSLFPAINESIMPLFQLKENSIIKLPLFSQTTNPYDDDP